MLREKQPAGAFYLLVLAVFTVISKKAFAKLVSANGLEKPERVVAEKEKSGLVIRVAFSISVTSKEKKEALYIGPKSNIQVGRTSVLDRKNWPDGRGRSISNRVWNDQP
jgi:hypothetical protein